MMRIKIGIRFMASLAVASSTFALGAEGASATTGQTWVSGSGTDTGTCAFAKPCATFSYAEGQTATGGTINVASSGSFGDVIVSKSLSIISADGVDAAISVPVGGTGVEVNAANAIVVLKGLHIGSPKVNMNTGISVISVGSLTIDNVSIVNEQVGLNPVSGFVLIRNSLIDGNTYGVFNSGANVFMGQSTVSGNLIGYVNGLNSYGDNDMNGNTQCDVCQATITESPHDQ